MYNHLHWGETPVSPIIEPASEWAFAHADKDGSPAESHTGAVTCSKEDTMHILWWIIVGLIAGWLTGKIM